MRFTITNQFVFHYFILRFISVSILGSLEFTRSCRVSGRQQAHQCDYYESTEARYCGLWYLHYLSQHLPCQAPSPYQAVWASKTRSPWFLGWGFWPRLQSTYSPLYQLTLRTNYKHSIDWREHLKALYIHRRMNIQEEENFNFLSITNLFLAWHNAPIPVNTLLSTRIGYSVQITNMYSTLTVHSWVPGFSFMIT
jgi:hypothetical protein